MLSLVDSMKISLDKFFPNIELNYTKFYIGLKRNGLSDNFISFKPSKTYVDIHKSRLSNEAIEKLNNNHELILERKDTSWRNYRIRIQRKQFEDKQSAIEI